ncbi:hypothetical protein KDL01_30000 [Actinospica durhamensis]|uniref:Uncharacterized protein n=1 Tax=Actinospica durhamensis TaxID=1508375 RepID=A0A941ETW1_9ACTN|nr:hypothetical protein [Actinospica durhamensis]MBR7837550.1 hypothetical protein [Actinospica durhamensis]
MSWIRGGARIESFNATWPFATLSFNGHRVTFWLYAYAETSRALKDLGRPVDR